MNTEGINDLLWNQYFQVTLVACTAAILVRAFAGTRPHLAHALWGLVLLKCITPPVIASPTGVFSWISSDGAPAHARIAPQENKLGVRIQGAADQQYAIVDAASSGSLANHHHSSQSWRQTAWAFAAQFRTQARRFPVQRYWLLGSLLLTVWFVCRLCAFLARVRSHSSRPSAVALQLSQRQERTADAMAKRLGIRRRVRVKVLDVLVGPAIIGLFRPCVVLPRVVVQAVSQRELDALLAHELVHFRRGDLWWSLIQALSLIFGWCHPMIWFVSRRLSQETELCCDEETIASLGIDSAAYANCLIAVLEQKHSLKAAPMLPGVRPIEVTSKRLEKIMRLGHGSHSRCPSSVKLMFLLGAAVALPGLPIAVAQNGARVEGRVPVHETAQAGNPSISQKDASVVAPPRSALHYEIQILEVPSERIGEQLTDWQSLGSVTASLANPTSAVSRNQSKVVPARFVTSTGMFVSSTGTKTIAIRKSEPLADEAEQKILSDATVLACPKIVAYEGNSADVFVGKEMPFTTSFEIVKDENGNAPESVQLIETKIPVGLSLSLNGQLDKNGESIQLQLEYDYKEVSDVFTFTHETAGGPVTVQAPSFYSNSIKTALKLPVGETVAVSGGPISKLVTKHTTVPVLSMVPYVGRLFKNVSAARVSMTPVILIHCEIVEAGDMPTLESPDSASIPQPVPDPRSPPISPPAPGAGQR